MAKNMNPNDIFWLTRYAHRVITPQAEAAGGYIIIHLHFSSGEVAPGIDVWVHHKDASKPGMIGHRIILTTKEQVDSFAASIWPAPALV